MDTLNTLQITLQHPRHNTWPVLSVLKFAQPDQPAEWRQTQLHLPDDWQRQLFKWELNSAKYGRLLGEALFHSGLDGLLQTAIASSTHTRLFLVIEPDDLKTLHWERLYFPIGNDRNDSWRSLAQEQRVLFSYYIPSKVSNYYPYLLQRDLKVLFFICSPTQTQLLGDKSFSSFATAPLAKTFNDSMGDIPHTILYQPQETSWKSLQDRLNEGGYTVLHIVSHGYYDDTNSKQNYLILLDTEQQLKEVSTDEFIEALALIAPLPHLLFFSSCHTADPAALTSIHGHFALKAREKLATPVVIAMSDTVTQETANILSTEFYDHLYRTAHVDLALAKAGHELSTRQQYDRYVPVLYQDLSASPLFGFEPKRLLELGKQEISDGLDRLKKSLLEEKRAPLAIHEFDLLAPKARARDKDALEELDQFCQEVTDISFATLAQDKTGGQLPAYHAECPFPGMRPFKLDTNDGVDYRKYFFGRQQEINEVIERLGQENILAIVGPSGSGKSSLVFAGILPELQKKNPDWQIPGETPDSRNIGMYPICCTEDSQEITPSQKLQHMLVGIDSQKPCLIVIDQFEEVFSTCDSTERKQFLQKLDSLPKLFPHIKILLTIRADYAFEEAYKEDLLKPILENKYFLDLMRLDVLRAVIEQQADCANLIFEEGLAHRIISEVIIDDHVVLPLLQHVLRKLWEERRGRHLLTNAYEKIGGVTKAIANIANTFFDKYPPLSDDSEDKEHKFTRHYLENIFLRLTRPDIQHKSEVDHNYRDTRQRILKSSLYPKTADSKLIDQIIKELSDANLIITYAAEVEISHESLIIQEPLKGWIANRQRIKILQELSEDAQNWNQARQEGNKRTNDLLQHIGSQIDSIEERQHSLSLFLNSTEEEYLNACRKRDQRVKRNRKIILVLFIFATIISILVVKKTNEYYDQMAKDYFQKGIELRDNQYQEWDKAEQYFAKALDVSANQQLKSELQFAYTDLRRFSPELTVLMPHKHEVIDVTLFANESRIITKSNDNAVRIWDINSGKMLGNPMQHKAYVEGFTLFANESRLLTWSDDTARVWDASTGDPISKPMQHKKAIQSATLFANESRVLTWSADGVANVWDALSGESISKPMQHKNGIRNAILFADESRILTWSDDGAAQAWNASTGDPISKPMQHEKAIQDAILFANESRVLTWSVDGVANVWDALSGEPISKQPMRHPDDVRGSTPFANGSRILTWSADGAARIWDANTGNLVGKPMQHLEVVLKAILFADESRILTWSSDDTARVWDASTGDPISKPMQHNTDVLQASLFANESRILTLDNGGNTQIWNANTGEPIGSMPHPHYRVNARLFADESRLLTWSGDRMTQSGMARIWDTESGKPISIPMQHQNYIEGVTLFADESRLLTWSDDGTTRIWDTYSGRPVSLPMQHQKKVKGATLFADETRLLTWSADGNVRIWKINTEKSVSNPMQHQGTVEGAHLFAGETRLLTWSDNGAIWVWNINTRKPVNPPMLHKEKVLGATLFADESRLLTWSRDKTAQIWDINTSKAIGSPMQHWQAVLGAKLFADESRVLTWGGDGAAKLWDTKTGSLIHTMPMQGNIEGATLFAGDSRILTWSFNGVVQVWDAQSCEPIDHAMQHPVTVRGVILFKDEFRVLTWSEDGAARIWNIKTGDVIGLMKHQSRVRKAILFADETRILIWYDDGSARIWDAKTGKLLSIPVQHQKSVQRAVLFDNESKIITWSYDGAVRVWKTDTGEPVGNPMQYPYPGLVEDAILFDSESKVLAWDNRGNLRIWDVNSGYPLSHTMQYPVKVGGTILFSDNSRILVLSGHTAQIWQRPSIDNAPAFFQEVKQSIQQGTYINTSGDLKFLSKNQWNKCQKMHEKLEKCADSDISTCTLKRQWWSLQKLFGTLPTIEDCLTPGETSP